MISSAILAMALWAAPAQGADRTHVRVTSSTLVQGDQVLAGDGRIVPRRRLVQRLGLMVRPATRSDWTFTTDMRLSADAGLDEPRGRPRGVEARSLDLRHALLEGRGLWGGRVDLRMGRQIRWDLADLLVFDGAHLRLQGPWGLAGETYAGWMVRRDASWLGASDLDPDARVATDEQTPTVGANLSVRAPGDLRGRAGWRRAWRGGRTVRELLSAGLTAGPRWGLRPDALLRYDVGLERLERADVGLAWSPPGDHGLSLDARGGHTRPSFDADSVFAWFDAETSEHGAASLRWRGGGVAAWGTFRRRWFGDDAPGASSTADGYAGGVSGPLGRQVRAGTSVRLRSGHGGDWTSAMVHGRWSPGPRGWTWDGRLRWSRFDAQGLERLDGHAWQVVAGASWPLTRAARLHVTGETNLTPYAAPGVRVFGLLDLALWH